MIVVAMSVDDIAACSRRSTQSPALPSNSNNRQIYDICVCIVQSCHIILTCQRHSPAPKHRQVYNALRAEIRRACAAGPASAERSRAGQEFGASRITVGRAVRDLQQEGLVERRAGSGTFVRRRATAAGRLSFGLLIPDLAETEILEPICQGLMAAPARARARVLWGARPGAPAPEGTSGVGAVPAVHRSPRVWRVLRAARADAGKDAVNGASSPRSTRPESRSCCSIAGPARTEPRGPRPRRHRQPPRRVQITEHLLRLGARRIAFVGVGECRLDGGRAPGRLPRSALHAHGAPVDHALARRARADRRDAVRG